MKIEANFSKILHSDLLEHTRAFYAGEIKHPCCDDCPDGCDGNHFYMAIDELKYKPLFEVAG